MTSLEREDFNEYLEKPLDLATGELSTQVNLSATSLSTGGIDGLLIIKNKGAILVEDGVTNRILIGYQANGF